MFVHRVINNQLCFCSFIESKGRVDFAKIFDLSILTVTLLIFNEMLKFMKFSFITSPSLPQILSTGDRLTKFVNFITRHRLDHPSKTQLQNSD